MLIKITKEKYKMWNNCNCGCRGLLNFFCGCPGRNIPCGCGRANSCGCYDEYYAMQYGLTNDGCGRSGWYNYNVTRTGCGCNNNRPGWEVANDDYSGWQCPCRMRMSNSCGCHHHGHWGCGCHHYHNRCGGCCNN